MALQAITVGAGGVGGDTGTQAANKILSNDQYVLGLLPSNFVAQPLPAAEAGYYRYDTGIYVANAAYTSYTLPLATYNQPFFVTGGYQGSSTALFTYFKADGSFISSQLQGTAGIVNITNQAPTIPALTATVRVTFAVASTVAPAVNYKVPASDPLTKTQGDANYLSKTDAKANYAPLAPFLGTVDVQNFATVPGYVNGNTGVVSTDAAWHRTDYLAVSDYPDLKFSLSITGGGSVAITSFFNAAKAFLGYGIKGPSSGTVSYIDQPLGALPANTVYFVISNDVAHPIELKYTGVPTQVSIDSVIPKQRGIKTWGDSLTAADKYQVGIRNIMPTQTTTNYGISSDWAQHIARRFVSFYQDAVPYLGTGTYPVPSLAARQLELQTGFFVIFMGTNNLLNFNRAAGVNTTGSPTYTALQPAPNFKLDRLYAKSYRAAMLAAYKAIVDIIPHGNFILVNGHAGCGTLNTDPAWQAMEAVDTELTRLYPRNFVFMRDLFAMDYDYLGISITASFVKPAPGVNVNITLSDATWIGDANKNADSKICIGTRDFYDTYLVSAVAGNVATATCIATGTEFIPGDTVSMSYDLVSDLGRDLVNIKMRVHSNSDIISWQNKNLPRSASVDGIHFTDAGYTLLGQLLGREILQRWKSAQF